MRKANYPEDGIRQVIAAVLPEESGPAPSPALKPAQAEPVARARPAAYSNKLIIGIFVGIAAVIVAVVVSVVLLSGSGGPGSGGGGGGAGGLGGGIGGLSLTDCGTNTDCFNQAYYYEDCKPAKVSMQTSGGVSATLYMEIRGGSIRSGCNVYLRVTDVALPQFISLKGTSADCTLRDFTSTLLESSGPKFLSASYCTGDFFAAAAAITQQMQQQ
jgi:hypothetical protein